MAATTPTIPRARSVQGTTPDPTSCCDTGQERVDGTAVAVCRVVEIGSRADRICGDERVELPVVADRVAGCRCQAFDPRAGVRARLEERADVRQRVHPVIVGVPTCPSEIRDRNQDGDRDRRGEFQLHSGASSRGRSHVLEGVTLGNIGETLDQPFLPDHQRRPAFLLDRRERSSWPLGRASVLSAPDDSPCSSSSGSRSPRSRGRTSSTRRSPRCSRGSRPAACAKADIEPTVTVIVAAYNEESVIARRIENLLELDYPARQAARSSSPPTPRPTAPRRSRCSTPGVR